MLFLRHFYLDPLIQEHNWGVKVD